MSKGKLKPREIIGAAIAVYLVIFITACGPDKNSSHGVTLPSDSTGAAIPDRVLGLRMVNRDSLRLEFYVNGALQETTREDNDVRSVSISLAGGQPFEISASWFVDSGFGESVEIARFQQSFERIPENESFLISNSDYDYEIDNDGDQRPNLVEIEDGTDPADPLSVKPAIQAAAVARIFLRWFNTSNYDVRLTEPDGAVVTPGSVFGRWTHAGEEESVTDFSDGFNSEIIFVTGGTPLLGLHTVTVTKFSEVERMGVDGFYVGCCGDRGDEPLDPGGFILDSFAFDFVGRDTLSVGDSFTFTFFVE